MTNKKNIFTQNLQNSENLKNFDNTKKLQKRKVLTININRENLNQFRTDAFMYYRDLDKLIHFSYTNYFKVCMRNVYTYFIEKYGSVQNPDPEFLKFYKKRGRSNGTAHLYHHVFNETEPITFLLNEYDTDMYYAILNTYYLNEQKNLASYSATFFFYDFINIVRELENIKYYSPDELQKEI